MGFSVGKLNPSEMVRSAEISLLKLSLVVEGTSPSIH